MEEKEGVERSGQGEKRVERGKAQEGGLDRIAREGEKVKSFGHEKED
ncbi:hypothetical protein NX871_32190 [Burkholderia thailandensis]|nr:hypothetical protein [Burkholderia thailandensis]MCS6474510.1 hypothetical protein [Burkholderia thailandensis]